MLSLEHLYGAYYRLLEPLLRLGRLFGPYNSVKQFSLGEIDRYNQQLQFLGTAEMNCDLNKVEFKVLFRYISQVVHILFSFKDVN